MSSGVMLGPDIQPPVSWRTLGSGVLGLSIAETNPLGQGGDHGVEAPPRPLRVYDAGLVTVRLARPAQHPAHTFSKPYVSGGGGPPPLRHPRGARGPGG